MTNYKKNMSINKSRQQSNNNLRPKSKIKCCNRSNSTYKTKINLKVTSVKQKM